jgi:hypothetical protein
MNFELKSAVGKITINPSTKHGELIVSCGSDAKSVARIISNLVNESEFIDVISCKFNGIKMIAEVGLSDAEVFTAWNEARESEAKAYLASPEYAEIQREAEKRKQNLQTRANLLMRQLTTLNFSHIDEVLDWVAEMEDCRDHFGVVYDFDLIVNTFNKNGFYRGMNCKENFNENDENNFAGWIIGQTLDKVYPPMAGHFIKQWKAKFRA